MRRKILKGEIILSIWVVSALVFLALLLFIFLGSQTRSAKGLFVFRDELKKSDLGGGIIRQYLGACDKMNAQHMYLADGSTVRLHSHPQVQFGYIIRGGLKAVVGNDTHILKAGDAYFAPAGVPHELTAIGRTEAVDVFSPIRSDIR